MENSSENIDAFAAEMEEIIRDFAACLENRKQRGIRFLPVSENSLNLVKSWGRAPEIAAPEFRGPLNASVFILDSENHFFDGASGELFTKILKAMHLSSDQVLVCATGERQAVIHLINQMPRRVVIALGGKAARLLLNTNEQIASLRGRFHRLGSCKVMPTFHPSLLIQEPEYKRHVWEDMKQVMALVAGPGNAS